MKRYNTINLMESATIINYDIPKSEFNDSVTDKSYFIPMAESIKRLGNSVISPDSIAMAYDFPTGRDTGMTLPTGRKLGRDLAEISTDIHNKGELIKQQLKEAQENLSITQSVDAALSHSISSSKATE